MGSDGSVKAGGQWGEIGADAAGGASFEAAPVSFGDAAKVQGIVAKGETPSGVPYGVAGTKYTASFPGGVDVSSSTSRGFSLVGDGVIVHEGSVTAPVRRGVDDAAAVAWLTREAQQASGMGPGGQVKVEWKVDEVGSHTATVSYVHTTVHSPGDMGRAATAAAAPVFKAIVDPIASAASFAARNPAKIACGIAAGVGAVLVSGPAAPLASPAAFVAVTSTGTTAVVGTGASAAAALAAVSIGTVAAAGAIGGAVVAAAGATAEKHNAASGNHFGTRKNY